MVLCQRFPWLLNNGLYFLVKFPNNKWNVFRVSLLYLQIILYYITLNVIFWYFIAICVCNTIKPYDNYVTHFIRHLHHTLGKHLTASWLAKLVPYGIHSTSEKNISLLKEYLYPINSRAFMTRHYDRIFMNSITVLTPNTIMPSSVRNVCPQVNEFITENWRERSHAADRYRGNANFLLVWAGRKPGKHRKKGIRTYQQLHDTRNIRATVCLPT